jgi:alkylhydroperoxidase/carboxymuconolactone decarboxylase family protein YurZ
MGLEPHHGRILLGRHLDAAREGPRRSHIRGARHICCTQEQVIEVFLHMTFYGGIAFARGAIDMANDVFAHG